MPRQERLRLMNQLETNLDSRGNARVICYLTGDRQGFETKMAFDVLPLLYEHLRTIGKTRTIGLFLYSTGGLTMAGWRIVSLIREFCDRFVVLVPYKAQSCATLVTLGADEIIMGAMGQLSPVDPTVITPYNPPAPFQVPGAPPQLLPVSVEDVASFIDLAKTEVKITDQKGIKEVFLKLAGSVSPLALGSVHRARAQISMLGEKLLGFHIKGRNRKEKIQNIISILTRKLFSHDYLISRKEAKDFIKLEVTEPSREMESLMWDLFQDYSNEMQLGAVFNPNVFLGDENQRELQIDRAFVESRHGLHAFRTRKIFRRREARAPMPMAPGEQMPQELIEERILQQEWVRVEWET